MVSELQRTQTLIRQTEVERFGALIWAVVVESVKPEPMEQKLRVQISLGVALRGPEQCVDILCERSCVWEG